MRPPVEELVGTGWDQLLAMMTVIGTIATVTSMAVIMWLRLRLRAYFVSRPDHETTVARHKTEHAQNTDRLKAVEIQMAELATKHALKNIEQRQEGLVHDVSLLKTALATNMVKIDGVGEGVKRVEHIMGILLEHHMNEAGK